MATKTTAKAKKKQPNARKPKSSNVKSSAVKIDGNKSSQAKAVKSQQPKPKVQPEEPLGPAKSSNDHDGIVAPEDTEYLESNTVNSDDKDDSQPEEVKPPASAYVRAILQVFGQWIKDNKLKALSLVLVPVLVATVIWVAIASRSNELSNDKIITKVNQELSISGDGNPAILTVVDNKKIKQPFLDQAQNGDKVILYYKAKKAVLYRPKSGQIVHHGTYTPPEAKIFIRKGTKDTAKIDSVRGKLESIKSVKIVSEDTSPSSSHRGITLVSVTDRYDAEVQQLEELLDTKVVRLPAGESFPDADILIIVGN